MTKKEDRMEYWFCTVGPVPHNQQRWGADAPLRASVKRAFDDMFPRISPQCRSGWGVTPEARDAISFATDPDDLKQAVIASMHDEKKHLPRYMRAWELLFAEDARAAKHRETHKRNSK